MSGQPPYPAYPAQTIASATSPQVPNSEPAIQGKTGTIPPPPASYTPTTQMTPSAQTPPAAPTPSAAQTGPFQAQSAANQTGSFAAPNSVAPVSIPTPSTATNAPSVPRITVRYPQPGSALRSSRGVYQVNQVIGRGEFGAVYDCIGPFDQVYAVKVIRPANRPYQEVHAEWAREVTRLMSLRHPNVVYIYDAFEEQNLFYLALERCDHPLTAMLGTPMQEGLVIELARQTLAAVQFLHDNDIVHDDLHPGNVLISQGGDRPTVKISDFGISHELRGAPAVRPNVVHHKIMAPEILASGYTSKQSDLYQVGLLLYWMVVGEPAVPPNLAYQDLARYVSEGEPRRRAEAIGTPLGMLIAKTLRRREAYRYTSANEVWADLRQVPSWQHRQLFPMK